LRRCLSFMPGKMSQLCCLGGTSSNRLCAATALLAPKPPNQETPFSSIDVIAQTGVTRFNSTLSPLGFRSFHDDTQQTRRTVVRVSISTMDDACASGYVAAGIVSRNVMMKDDDAPFERAWREHRSLHLDRGMVPASRLRLRNRGSADFPVKPAPPCARVLLRQQIWMDGWIRRGVSGNRARALLLVG
jgi:hypothetical protein